MIAHVAAADENRGRVVLRITTAQPSPVALDAAIQLAQGFRSEIECLFVEDADLIALAEFPFAREISRTGRPRRELTRAGVEAEFKAACRIAERMVTGRAERADVPVRVTVVRDEPVHALATTCAQCGPRSGPALPRRGPPSRGRPGSEPPGPGWQETGPNEAGASGRRPNRP